MTSSPYRRSPRNSFVGDLPTNEWIRNEGDGDALPAPKRASEGTSNKQFLAGLTLAGLASALITTIFGLFSVDTFLTAYKLPLASYAAGNFIYSFVNTANDLAGAWIVDSIALRSSRSGVVAVSGCLFGICFLAPFFRWDPDTESSTLWDSAHFVVSMSLYDTMYSFTAILLGSMITDNHDITENERISSMASGKVVNMVASLFVARIGLMLFNSEELSAFRNFLLLLCLFTCFLFTAAQIMMHSNHDTFKHRSLRRAFSWSRSSLCDDADSNPLKKTSRQRLILKSVVRDFVSHGNFRAWIVMELLLESQSNFASSFLKTFVDRLLAGNGLSRGLCDWLLSSVRPLSQIAGIACYMPIRKNGYHEVYMNAFKANLALSAFLFLFGSPSSTFLVAIFIIANSVMTSAVSSAGFHLAMSDMVLEMKVNQIKERRFNEPSLAGLFMGANALVCKPMDSFLPIVAATLLARTGFSEQAPSSDAVETVDDDDPINKTNVELDSQWMLFYLLIGPPMVFSVVQILAWSRYKFDRRLTEEMRMELQKLQSRHQNGRLEP